jgi:hypothetical protein
MEPLKTVRMADLDPPHKAPTQPLTLAALHVPSRSDKRAKTLELFQGAVTESSVQLAKAFTLLREAVEVTPSGKAEPLKIAQKHIASSIAALEPIALVIEGQASELPAIATWLVTATEGLRELLRETGSAQRITDPTAREAKIKSLIYQFPLLTEELENLIQPPLKDAQRHLQQKGS